MQDREPWESRSRRKVNARGASQSSPAVCSRAQGGEVPSRVTEKEGGTQQQLEIHMSKEGEDATSTEGRAGKWNQDPHWTGSTAEAGKWDKDPTGQGRRQMRCCGGYSNIAWRRNSRNYRKRNELRGLSQMSRHCDLWDNIKQHIRTHESPGEAAKGKTETDLKKQWLKCCQIWWKL